MEKPPVMILSYADSHSTNRNSMDDYEIGKNTKLIGSNKSFGAERKHVFALLRTNGRDYIGYCGFSGNRVTTQQPWADAGGQTWKYIYESTAHDDLEYLNVFCEKANVNSQIFIRSKRFGHPHKDDYAEYWKVLNYLSSRK
jgi:hypothetical protein